MHQEQRSPPAWNVRRLDGNPLLTPTTHPLAGHNIQGPSVIAVPPWVEAPLGRFYLYFADHKGHQIGLAYADQLEGPWRVHPAGALTLQDSSFPTEPVRPGPDAPALTPPPDWAPPEVRGIPTLLEDFSLPHIASPDVHVDAATRSIRMYFHGLERFGRQTTRVATSTDGLHFSVQPVTLGPSYFRVFAHGGAIYALVMPGILYRANDWGGPFEKGPDLFGERRQRHSALLCEGDTLWVFWSRVGDTPERILCSRVDLAGPWTTWRAGEPTEVLRPEHAWEGADQPLLRSWRSAVDHPVHQLRDPAVLQHEGRQWLFYALAGESGIGAGELLRAGP